MYVYIVSRVMTEATGTTEESVGRARKTFPSSHSDPLSSSDHGAWACASCALVFASESTWHEHMATVHEERDERHHLCWRCGMLMNSLIAYNEHVLRHELVALVERLNDYGRMKRATVGRFLYE